MINQIATATTVDKGGTTSSNMNFSTTSHSAPAAFSTNQHVPHTTGDVLDNNSIHHHAHDEVETLPAVLLIRQQQHEIRLSLCKGLLFAAYAMFFVLLYQFILKVLQHSQELQQQQQYSTAGAFDGGSKISTFQQQLSLWLSSLSSFQSELHLVILSLSSVVILQWMICTKRIQAFTVFACVIITLSNLRYAFKVGSLAFLAGSMVNIMPMVGLQLVGKRFGELIFGVVLLSFCAFPIVNFNDTVSSDSNEELRNVIAYIHLIGRLVTGFYLSWKYHKLLETTITKIQEKCLLLEDALAQARIAKQEKETLIANLSHEIRTPCVGLVSMSKELLDHYNSASNSRETSNDGSDELEYLCTSTIYSCSTNLLKTLNSILDICRFERGLMNITKAPVNFYQFIEDLSVFFRSMLVKKHIEMQIDIAIDVPTIVIADSLRLQQVILNLVSNSIKYSQHGCETKHKEIVLSVRVVDESELSPRQTQEEGEARSTSSDKMQIDTEPRRISPRAAMAKSAAAAAAHAIANAAHAISDTLLHSSHDATVPTTSWANGTQSGTTVTDAPKKTRSYLMISVKDNGIGISEEKLGSLFKPFVQLLESKAANDVRSNSSGWGLYLSNELVKMMSGCQKGITVQSQHGVGSVFSFCLPLEEYDEAKHQEHESQKESTTNQQQQQQQPQASQYAREYHHHRSKSEERMIRNYRKLMARQHEIREFCQGKTALVVTETPCILCERLRSQYGLNAEGVKSIAPLDDSDDLSPPCDILLVDVDENCSSSINDLDIDHQQRMFDAICGYLLRGTYVFLMSSMDNSESIKLKLKLQDFIKSKSASAVTSSQSANSSSGQRRASFGTIPSRYAVVHLLLKPVTPLQLMDAFGRLCISESPKSGRGENAISSPYATIQTHQSNIHPDHPIPQHRHHNNKKQAPDSTNIDTEADEDKREQPPKRILFVEDDEMIQRVMKFMLRKYCGGLDAQFVSDGADALRYYKENPHQYDMIITDLHMPKLSGIELASEIRKIEEADAAQQGDLSTNATITTSTITTTITTTTEENNNEQYDMNLQLQVSKHQQQRAKRRIPIILLSSADMHTLQFEQEIKTASNVSSSNSSSSVSTPTSAVSSSPASAVSADATTATMMPIGHLFDEVVLKPIQRDRLQKLVQKYSATPLQQHINHNVA